MAKVNGKDAILYKYNEVTLDWVHFGCARSLTLDISREMVETSITGNGVFKTYIPGAGSVTGTIEGLVFLITTDFELVTMKNLYDLIIDGTTFNIKYYETDITNSNYLQKELTVLLESLNETASFDNMVTFSANFRGVGAPSVTAGIPGVIPKVTIGSQTWTSQNFMGTHYLNGDLIPFAANEEEWNTFSGNGIGAWCFYDFNTDNADYGRLYNWFAATDSRGIGYVGFHLPTDSEWNELKTSGEIAGDALKLKETGTDYWTTNNGVNTFGFNARGNGDITDAGTSENLKDVSFLWTADADGVSNAITWYITDAGDIANYSLLKGYGLALRFIQD